MGQILRSACTLSELRLFLALADFPGLPAPLAGVLHCRSPTNTVAGAPKLHDSSVLACEGVLGYREVRDAVIDLEVFARPALDLLYLNFHLLPDQALAFRRYTISTHTRLQPLDKPIPYGTIVMDL